jgi:hypothetical protein
MFAWRRYVASDSAERWGNGNVTACAAFEAQHRAAHPTSRLHAGAHTASDAIVKDLTPILAAYGVDLYVAGHWHYYESLWPAVNGSTTCLGCAQPVATSFDNPRGTVHITTGNAGPPSKDSFVEDCGDPEDCRRIAATRKQTTEYGYGRLVAHNATHIEFTQLMNADQSVFDHFWIVQESHGPFAM